MAASQSDQTATSRGGGVKRKSEDSRGGRSNSRGGRCGRNETEEVYQMKIKGMDGAVRPESEREIERKMDKGAQENRDGKATSFCRRLSSKGFAQVVLLSGLKC